MPATRQPPPIQIYQDYAETRPQSQPLSHSQPQSQKRRPQLAPSAMPLQPTRNNQPPAFPLIAPGNAAKQHQQQQMSPAKLQYPSMPQDYSPITMVPNMSLPESGPVFTDSPQKRMSLPSSQPLLPAPPMYSQPMFSSWDSNHHFDQENAYMPMPVPNHFVDFSDPNQMSRGTLKRSYSETVANSEKPTFKKGKPSTYQDDGEEVIELPLPEDMPAVLDDGQKPPYSYAQMIGMAILRSPGRRLTLANIYEWIASTFVFYREDPKTGWHNSIRHNLSLNKAFIKQERPKSDAGKGCYWVVQPGMEVQFFKDKPRKTNQNMSMQQQFNAQPPMSSMPQPMMHAIQPQPWIIHSAATMEPPAPAVNDRLQTTSAVDPALPELSSDATLPASDPALGENDEDMILTKEVPDLAPPSMPPPPSSPPVINSSPPVVPRNHHRTVSSPAHLISRPSVRRRRTTTGMDDSGYFSSLESSAKRTRHGEVMPTSELGFLPRQKVGRAEEEIARIRSSSHDITPSGRRLRRAALDAQRSSSPLRESPRDAPATPPVIFKKPYLPPQSISPNTQLKRHRDAMSRFIGGSPGKRDDPFGNDADTFSPAFKFGTPGLSTSFDESFLYDFANPGTPMGSSPLKPAMSTKRSALRPSTSASVLSDVTKRANGNTKLNVKTPSKLPGNVVLKAPNFVGFAGSPLKKSSTTKHVEFQIFNDENDDSLFDFGSFPDEGSDELEDFDITQGFTKIGSSNLAAPAMAKSSVGFKPSLARSHTSRF